MKKILPIIVILILLGIGGYFYLSSQGKTMKPTDNKGNVFTSIKDALSKYLSLKCVYKDEEGVETTSYIKGGAVRVMMAKTTDAEQPNNFIMKDKKMYMWNDINKTGFVFEIDEPIGTPVPTFKVEKGLEPEKQPGVDQQESVLAQIEKYKDACKTEVIADSMFTVPNNVQFQDMNSFQEQIMKELPQGETPKGIGNGQGYDMESIKQMMEEQGVNQ